MPVLSVGWVPMVSNELKSHEGRQSLLILYTDAQDSVAGMLPKEFNHYRGGCSNIYKGNYDCKTIILRG